MRISDWSSDVCSSVLLDPRLLRRLGDERVEFALRTQAKRHRILGDNIGAVPVAAVADRADRVAGGADQLADRAVRHFGVVLQYPRDAVGLVLALADRGVEIGRAHV